MIDFPTWSRLTGGLLTESGAQQLRQGYLLAKANMYERALHATERAIATGTSLPFGNTLEPYRIISNHTRWFGDVTLRPRLSAARKPAKAASA